MMNNCFTSVYLSQFGEFRVWWAPMASKSKALEHCGSELPDLPASQQVGEIWTIYFLCSMFVKRSNMKLCVSIINRTVDNLPNSPLIRSLGCDPEQTRSDHTGMASKLGPSSSQVVSWGVSKCNKCNSSFLHLFLVLCTFIYLCVFFD